MPLWLSKRINATRTSMQATDPRVPLSFEDFAKACGVSDLVLRGIVKRSPKFGRNPF
jgi:hypothetical protein